MRPRLPRLARLAVVVSSPTSSSLASTSSPAVSPPRGSKQYTQFAVQHVPRARPAAATSAAVDVVQSASANFPHSAASRRQQLVRQQEGASTVSGTREASTSAAWAAAGGAEEALSLFEDDYPDNSFTDEPAQSAVEQQPEPVQQPARPTPRKRPPPPHSTPPRNFLFPSVDSLFEQPLPSSEPELYSYLHLVKATQRSVRPEWLAWFHAQPRIVPFTSSRTYRFLIQYAFEASNLRLVRGLLADMEELGTKRDEQVLRVLLRGYLRHGKDDEAREVAQAMGRKWIALQATKPRIAGDAGEGMKPAEFEVLWKGWDARGRDFRKRDEVREAMKLREEMVTGRRVGGKVGRRRVQLPSPPRPLPTLPSTLSPRTYVSIPRNPTSLSSSDITALVDLLIQDGRRPAAFALAKSWLEANRPVPPAAPPPSLSPIPHNSASSATSSTSDLPTFGSLVAQYSAAALVLLHLLLRSLILECPSWQTIRTFLDTFLSQHSPPPPSRPLTPNLVTLRLLVSAFHRHPEAWQETRNVIDWFGYRWGMPIPGKPHSHRLYFTPPSKNRRHRLRLYPSQLAYSPFPYFPTFSSPPSSHVPPDLALLLLRHAISSRQSGALYPKSRLEEVRTWWAALDRDPAKNEAWAGHKARVAWKKAVEAGVVEGVGARKKKDYREKVKEAKREREEARKRNEEEK
ncbi:hypothetical protein JCM8547_009106 [Rhodosporidiobolus lusitaniae]